MITAKHIMEKINPLLAASEEENMIKTQPGGKDDHTHMYDPTKSGRTSMTNDHDHKYTVGNDTTGPANDEPNEHMHGLDEDDDLEA